MVPKVGPLKDRGDLIQLAAPDNLSKAAKQENKMAIKVEIIAANPDIAECVAVSIQSGTKAHDASRILPKHKKTKSHELEPGDLAVVVKDDSDQLNLGVIVRVLSDSGLSWWSQWDAKNNAWGSSRLLRASYVEALSTRGLSYHSDDCAGDLVVHRFGTIPTSYLRRIDQ